MQLRNNNLSWSILLTIINMLLYIYTYYYVIILLLQLTMLAIYVSRENGAIICIYQLAMPWYFALHHDIE